MYKYTVINIKTLRGISGHFHKKNALKAKAKYIKENPDKKKIIEIMVRVD